MNRIKAERSKDKSVRVATHITVLERLFSTFPIDTVIEHGSGTGSTPYFGKKNVKLHSIEDDPKWKIDVGQTTNTFQEFMKDEIPNADLYFVDGPNTQRDELLPQIFDKTKMIVVHDFEIYDEKMLDSFHALANVHGFTLHHYVGENPETGLYLSDSLDKTKFDFNGFV